MCNTPFELGTMSFTLKSFFSTIQAYFLYTVLRIIGDTISEKAWILTWTVHLDLFLESACV